jgi:hypothetical protein
LAEDPCPFDGSSPTIGAEEVSSKPVHKNAGRYAEDKVWLRPHRGAFLCNPSLMTVLLSSGTEMTRWPERLIIIALFVMFLLSLIEPLAFLQAHVPRGYNEGWDAYHAHAAVSGGTLYPPPNALITNNYPPLSFYLVGGLGLLLGDDIVAGRVVGLVSSLVVAGNIFLILRVLSGTTAAAAFGAVLWLGLAGITFFPGLGSYDPTFLGLAVMTTGLAVFLGSRDGRFSGLGSIISIALMTAGALVKHNLIALPLAVLLWCIVYDRRTMRTWLLAGSVLAVSALGLLYAVFGLHFFQDVFHDARRLSAWHLAQGLARFVTPILPLVIGAIGLHVLDGKNRYVRLILLYAAVSAAFSTFFLLGIGVGDTIYYELTATLCIAAGLLIDRVRVTLVALAPASPGRPTWAMLALALPIAPFFPGAMLHTLGSLTEMPEKIAKSEAQIALLAAAPGPAACQTLSLCYWAGKTFELDFFNTHQKIAKGRFTDAGLLDKVANKYYGAIEISAGAPSEQQLPDRVAASLHANYKVAHQDGGLRIYVPK